MNKRNLRPLTRWLNHFTCPLLVIVAAVMAFPQLIGSNDEPTYSLAITFLALSVVFGIANDARSSETQRDKEQEIVDGATEFAVGKIKLEEYES